MTAKLLVWPAEALQPTREAISLKLDGPGDHQDRGHSRPDHSGALLCGSTYVVTANLPVRQLTLSDHLLMAALVKALVPYRACAEPPYSSSLAASVSDEARRSRDDTTVTGRGHGTARSGSSNAIDTSSDGS